MKKSMKITSVLGCVVFGLSLMSAPVFAETDYSAMTNEEMAQMRGTMRNADTAEQEAFRAEWQERVNNMSQEERQNAVGRPENAIQDGAGNKYRQGNASGSGSGMGSGGGGVGSGAGSGRGRR